jgi:DNA polymerase-3 subunit gamma/tau
VQEIDAASHTQVDNVREAIIGTIGFAPARDRFKIFIIDEVHMLSTHSFNALLKTIEEPPDRVVFIMATTERHKVPETILSRSQQFEFRTIATAKILERLRLIAKAEGIKVDEDALREIARSGEGSMRDAQSAFDQVISFSGASITKGDVELALGVAGADILIRVMTGIAENKPAEALAVVDDVVMRGHDLRNFCRDVLAHLRDVLVTKVSGSDELLESAICDRNELKRQAALFSESDLVRFFHSLAETETKLRTAAHPRYQLEIGLVKLMEMRRLEPITELIDRITALEESISTGKPVQSSPSNAGGANIPSSSSRRTVAGSSGSPSASSMTATAAKPALESPSPIAASPKLAATSPDTLAKAVSEVDRIKAALETRRKMFLVTAMESASTVLIERDELYVEFAPASRHLRDTLAKSENMRILREACCDVLGRDTGVRIVIKDNSEPENAPLSREDEIRLEKQRLRNEVENNPVVQQMVRTFRGEIVDVQPFDGK